MASHSKSSELPFGAVKLCQNIATLLNNRQGSDIQFKVGGIVTQGSGETIYNESTTVTLYAHSLILQCRSSYFAAMLDEEKNWKESSNGVIYKPNISAATFQDVLYYLYTGNVRASGNIMELIEAADEMDLEELSVECQNKIVRTVKSIFSEEDERSTKEYIPIDVAVRTHIIPALNLASSHYLSNFSQEILTVILPHMSLIVKSPDAYTEFVNEVSSEALVKIISSDDLAMKECDIWDLALSWTCHQTNLSKTAIENYLSNLDYDKEDGMELSDRVTISDTQLKQFKEVLTPLLPAIRFSLFNPDDYENIANTLINILPRRRYLEINNSILRSSSTGLLDTPRKNSVKPKMHSKMAVEFATLLQLRETIFETGGIAGCHSSYDLKLELLFQMSEHGSHASTFHQRCDNKGPTLVIIRSSDGHLFGGVNFNHWKSNFTYSSSELNFLFALPDKHHRKDLAIFKIKRAQARHSSGNDPQWGPIFGSGSLSDLAIAHSAHTGQISYSYLPFCYDGNGASHTALAGFQYFTVSDYEVFAISKRL